MAVVLVHGNPETPAVWDLMAERLREQGYPEPVRLAPPGFGAPLPAGFKPSPVAYRDWLAGQLEVIGEPVDLVGHWWMTENDGREAAGMLTAFWGARK